MQFSKGSEAQDLLKGLTRTVVSRALNCHLLHENVLGLKNMIEKIFPGEDKNFSLF